MQCNTIRDLYYDRDTQDYICEDYLWEGIYNIVFPYEISRTDLVELEDYLYQLIEKFDFQLIKLSEDKFYFSKQYNENMTLEMMRLFSCSLIQARQKFWDNLSDMNVTEVCEIIYEENSPPELVIE